LYEYLEGRLVSRAPAKVVLDVGGVGYDLSVPVGADFPPVGEDAARVRLWTHLVVREDAHQLYGFASSAEREIFRLLLSVRGVGPGLALAILSSLSADQLLLAIQREDVGALKAIRGVGKKTAEQVLLDLRDKAPRLAGAGVLDEDPARREEPRSRIHHDAVQALVSVGYTDKQAEASVKRAAARVPEDDLESLVRAALQE
jgi:Holliday junction DNA helicase RuvA